LISRVLRDFSTRWIAAASIALAGPVAVSMVTPASGAPSFQSPTSAPDFRGVPASGDAQRVAEWVLISKDNQGSPFVLIDKLRAKVFVFDANGRLLGSTFALLGRAKGDDSVPGIGARRLHSIRPGERTTPAGRFIAELGRDFEHDVVWIDYKDGISLHRVVHGDPGDNRLQRLSTDTARDKRISYGCINVPARFYDEVVLPLVKADDPVVYILPESKTLAQVFGISDISTPSGH
jgi:hypothetical protein